MSKIKIGKGVLTKVLLGAAGVLATLAGANYLMSESSKPEDSETKKAEEATNADPAAVEE